MDSYNLINDLQAALTGVEVDAVTSAFNRVKNTNDVRQLYIAVSQIISDAHRLPRMESLLVHLGDVIVRDRHRQERVNILAHLPYHMRKNRTTLSVAALNVANLLLETNEEEYQKAKQVYAQQILEFAELAISRQDVANDSEAVDYLRYLEKYIHPKWDSLYMQRSNDAYGRLAKRLNNLIVGSFMEAVMASENYSYHSLMTALTRPAHHNVLKLKPALEFMQRKHITCVGNELIGEVNRGLQIDIEVQFIKAVLKNLAVYDIENVMSTLSTGAIVHSDVLQEIAKLHIMELHNTKELKPETHALIYFVRQCALSKYYKGEKKAVLLNAMRFFENVDGMNNLQQRVFCSVLASQSHPREEGRPTGGLQLFHFLFTRLLNALPPLGRDEVTVDMNAIQNVVYSIYSLYAIDEKKKELMTAIDPKWCEKINHTLDLLCVTSKNIEYQRNCAGDKTEQREHTRMLDVISCTGQLLCYALGKFQRKTLTVAQPYDSLLPEFIEDEYSASFTKLYLCKLTKTPIEFNCRIPFVHRNSFDVIDDDSDSDSDSDSEESGEESGVDNNYDDDDPQHVRLDGNSDGDTDDVLERLADDSGTETSEERLYKESYLTVDLDPIPRLLRIHECGIVRVRNDDSRNVLDEIEEVEATPVANDRDDNFNDSVSEYTIGSTDDEEEDSDEEENNDDLDRELEIAKTRRINDIFEHTDVLTFSTNEIQRYINLIYSIVASRFANSTITGNTHRVNTRLGAM